MSKQDGYASRTAADLERKYNFGKTFAEVYGLVSDAQKAADEAQAAFDGLNQDQIFNLLTNFGKAQGIYRDDAGNVYVNASYIKSGKLSADRIDATNLKVDAANITGQLEATNINTKDLVVYAANIEGKLTAGNIDTTNLKVSAANITGVLAAEHIDAANLKVKAANITGVLTADHIDAANLSVNAANITGTLSSNALTGATISGGNFTDLYGKVVLTMDEAGISGSYGLVLRKSKADMFAVWTNGYYTSIELNGSEILSYGDGTIYAFGVWDFSGATVYGI